MRFQRSWQTYNPEFSYRLFDDAACEALVADVVPHLLNDYRRFPHAVMRADFFRYAAIYRDGGVYADIDMECVRPIAPLLTLAPVMLSVEAHLTARRQHELGYALPFQIANCIFAARPGHPFFMEAMERSAALGRERSQISRAEIEDVTGPRMLTRLFFEQPRADFAVLQQIYLMPPRHYPDVWPLNIRIHARHHFFGSWKGRLGTRSISRALIERDRWPNPFAVDFLEPRLSTANSRYEDGR